MLDWLSLYYIQHGCVFWQIEFDVDCVSGFGEFDTMHAQELGRKEPRKASTCTGEFL